MNNTSKIMNEICEEREKKVYTQRYTQSKSSFTTCAVMHISQSQYRNVATISGRCFSYRHTQGTRENIHKTLLIHNNKEKRREEKRKKIKQQNNDWNIECVYLVQYMWLRRSRRTTSKRTSECKHWHSTVHCLDFNYDLTIYTHISASSSSLFAFLFVWRMNLRVCCDFNERNTKKYGHNLYSSKWERENICKLKLIVRIEHISILVDLKQFVLHLIYTSVLCVYFLCWTEWHW